MKKKSIFFTLLICIFSVFGTFAFFDVDTASAASTSASVWDGEYVSDGNKISSLDYYQDGTNYYIRSAKGFSYFASRVNALAGYQTFSGSTIYLETDIDLADNGWKPIGNNSQFFQGTFDGQNHSIFNLNVEVSNSDYAGLFGYTTGVIKNLKIKNASITASAKYVGTIAGEISGLTNQNRIDKCSVSGKVKTNSNEVIGGLVGQLTNSKLYRSFSETSISSSATSIGGLVGSANNAEIEQSYYEGEITSTSSYAGGLVGQTKNNVTIKNCYNVGGVVGGSSNVGGLVGRNDGTLNLQYVYNTGSVSGAERYNAGLVGFNGSNLTIHDALDLSEKSSYNQENGITTANNIYDANFPLIESLSRTREFYSDTYFSSDWDFSNVWNISTGKNNSLPYLITVNVSADNDVDYSLLAGSGVAGDPYQIKTAGDLGWLSFNYETLYRAELEKGNSYPYFALQNNIDLSGKTWQPIGSGSLAFSGVFDGNGYTISGMTCSLQDQFSWHGLFGMTKDAVIKNLTIANAKIITASNNESAGYVGSLVGEARDKTYIINCTDYSGIQNLSTVGKVDENNELFVIFGKKNSNLDGRIVETSLNLDGVEFTKGYDIEINGDGGQFYGPDKSIYMGVYHVLVLANEALNEVISVKSSIGKIIDTTFGKTLLPTTSKEFGSKDVLLKRGYQLAGYKYNFAYAGNVGEKLDADNIGLGLTAIWSGPKTITLSVVYNAYESEYFDVTSVLDKSFEIAYDSFLQDFYPEIFETSSCPVQREGFVIEGIYKDFDDGTFKDKVGNEIVNDSFASTLYAKWKGTCQTSGQINVVFHKTEDIFADNFKLSDAVQSLTLKKMGTITDPNIKEVNTNILKTLGEKAINISFDYNTLYSDTMDNYLKLNLALNDGYKFTGSVVYKPLSEGIDKRFGTLKLSGVDESGDGSFSVGTLDDFNDVQFYNLSGDYIIDVSLQRSTYSNTITTGVGVIFGVAPNVKATNLTETYIYNFKSSSPEYLNSLGFSGADVYVGYDFINNKLLTTSASYNAITLDSKYISEDGKIRLQIGSGDNARYFEYQKNTETFYSVTLYETDSNFEPFEKIVSLTTTNGIEYEAKWLSKSSFEYIFSTESKSLVFNNIQPSGENGYIDQNVKTMTGDDDKETKFAMKFEDKLDLEDIQAVTAYIQAVFHYNFVDKDGKQLDNPPILRNSDTTKNISEQGEIDFKFESSKYWKFAGEQVNLYDGGDYNLKLEVSNVAGDDDKNTWQKGFNSNNKSYFSNIMTDHGYMLKTAGERDENTKMFKPDTYSFSLPFAAGDLKAGYYEVYIVCVPVLYRLQVETKFVDYSNTTGNQKPTNFTSEENHNIITSASNLTNLDSNLKDIKYADEIAIATELGDNKAYEFYGWYFKGENYSGYINLTDPTYTFEYGDRYLNSIGNAEGEQYNLKITAVYVKKEAVVELSNSVVLTDIDGVEGEEKEFSASTLQLEFALNKQLIYQYENLDETGTSLHNVEIVKNGNYANGYYLVGWKLMLGEQLIETYQDEAVLQEFDLYEIVKAQIESGNTSLSQTFTLVPIIKQKSVTIYFHSGATGDYKQGIDGQVFDINGTETTENIYSYSTYFNNTSIYLGEALDGYVMDDQFATRTGYHAPSNNYWYWEDGVNAGTLNGSSVVLSASFFANASTAAELHFYRIWSANTYYVKFNGNNSTGGSMSNQEFTYDIAQNLTLNGYTRNGYTFDGWATTADGEKVYENQESVRNLTTNYGQTIELFAVWMPKQYNIRIYTNAANSFNGQSIDLDAQLENYVEYQITYGHTFAEIDLGAMSATRNGYSFAGIFTKNKNQINEQTVFDSNLYGFIYSNDIALNLYVGWNFDSSNLNLSGVNSNLGTLVYDATNQTVELWNGFADAKSSSYIFSKDDNGHLLISMPEDWHTSVLTTLSSSSIDVINARNTFFSVKDAGSYYVNLEILLTDKAGYLSLGNVTSKTLQFYVIVNKADVIAITDKDALLVSVKKLLKVYSPQSQISAINSCTTFEGLGNLLGISEASGEEIAKFIVTKYYNMLTSVGSTFTTYKDWTFDDFAEFEKENTDYVDGLVKNFTMVEFYNYGLAEYALSGYDANIHLTSESVSAIELTIQERKIFTYGSFLPNNLYELRLYLTASSVVENYQVYEDDGKYYISAGQVLLLPEIVTLENRETNKYTYFNQSQDFVDVAWQGDRTSFDYNKEQYYLLKDNLYVNAEIYTSNLGRFDLDTPFNFKDSENYLYFNQISVLEKISDEEVVNLTDRFSFVMSEDDIFTILSTKGMARFDISARYLTNENGMTLFDVMPTSIYEGLLKITSVTYDRDGELITKQDMSGLAVQSFEDDGAALFQVLANNANTVSIFVNQSVKKIVVNTATNYVNDYIALYKWATSYVGYIDGTMETNGNFEIDMSALTFSEEKLSEFFYFAVFTDLVQVSYNLNLPEGYTNSTNSTLLRLGVSTYDDLPIPNEDGLILTNLYLTKLDGGKVNILENPAELFAGENGKFVGLNANSKHTRILLGAKWRAEQMNCQQNITSYKLPVLTFNGLRVSDVASIENKNETLYSYTYKWYKDDELLSTAEQLRLSNMGSYDESGSYSLQITATLKKMFESSVDNPQDAETIVDIPFEMMFLRDKVQDLSLPEQTETIYDAQNHINDWTVGIEIASYNSVTDDYDAADLHTYHYVANGEIKFEISKDSTTVVSMKNAGTYLINVLFDENIYELASGLTTSFEYTILPFEVDLLDQHIELGKVFNSQEVDLERETTLTSELVTLTFTREVGEDVGEYDLYLKDILGDDKQNYIFKAKDIVVFENGSLTNLGKTTPIGVFEISASGKLVLSYETSSTLPAQILAEYYFEGYTISLKDNFVLEIANSDKIFKTIDLQLYDEYSKKAVSSQTLQILSRHISALTAKFFDTTAKDNIVESGYYTYYIELDEEFRKYYSAVEFEAGFGFNIQQIGIDVSKFVLDKTYDGQTEIYLTTSGEKIEDIDSYSGLYVFGQYESAHVGKNIKVDFQLLSKNSSENLSNYLLSSSFAYANISKLVANLTLSMTRNNFEYGTLSQSNFYDFISDDFIVTDTSGKDVTSILIEGYYQLFYSLPSNVSLSSTGFVRKGEYSLNVQGDFNDFDMTCSNPEFIVEALTVQKDIPEGYITIGALENVKEEYSENITLNQTGDILTLKYYAVGLTANQTAPVGTYNLALKENTFENDSIVVTLTENNKGFVVLAETEIVYVRLKDDAILEQKYNALDFVLSVENKTLTLTNDTNSYESDLIFFTKDGSEENILTDIEFGELQISGTFKNAGNYRLTLRALSSQYTNVMFEKEYYFVITPISIDVGNLTLTKAYDGSDSLTISEFNEKITSDNVSILVKFAGVNVGEKAVTLYLQGEQKNNYLLGTQSSTGIITKADAQVVLTKTQYIFGQIDDRNLLSYNVISGGKVLLSSQYNLTLQLANPTYSSMRYLNVGSYQVSMTNPISDNYNISFDEESITISPLTINPTFSISGEVYFESSSSQAQSTTFEYSYLTDLRERITLILTREEGFAVGSYRVLSGISQDDNYVVGTVTDSSESGMFKLTKAKETLYLLLSDEQTLSAEEGGLDANMIYDGKEYDRVGISSRGTGLYNLMLYNSIDSTIKQEFELNYYTLDSTTNTYNKVTELIDGLETVLKFLSTSLKDVGRYTIYSSGTVSSNFDVRMGKNGEIYSYYINVQKRELYFKDEVLQKVFDNKAATFNYDDASELIDNIVEGETLTLTVNFMDGAEYAKYAGTKYTVQASIAGDTVSNYNLNIETRAGEAVSATITRADIKFVINSQTFQYGSAINLEYSYVTTVDLDGYDMSRMNISLLPSVSDANYSTSGALKVGEYSMILLFNADDFNFAGYITDNKEQTELIASLSITPIELTITPKNLSLSEIFTKAYDGTNTVNITDNNGELLFNLNGIYEGKNGRDIVTISQANYLSENIGQSIQIDFILYGQDASNYTLSSYPYGVIEAVVINLYFDYRAEGAEVVSNVESNKLELLSQLSFPFMSMSNLTSNSNDISTNNPKNFPTSLIGRTGYSFVYWTLEFENIANGSTELSYLDSLTNTLGMTTSYNAEKYVIRVGNDENTVKLLNALLTDERDLFKLYYKTHEDISVTFTANWDINKYRVTVMLADEDGNSATYGTAEITVGSGESTLITSNFVAEYEYDSALTLRATANEHSLFKGFYINGNLLTGSEEYISAESDGKVYILKISNLRQSYNIVVRFSTQKVNIKYDLSNFIDASVADENFEKQADNSYIWKTNYIKIQSLTLADLPEISRLGFEVEGLSTGTNYIEVANFSLTKLVDLLGSSSEEITLTLTPTFEAIGVLVTLDFGYDNKTVQISVPFGQSYNTAENWQESPEREGYQFLKWQDENGNTVVGSDKIRTVTAHTLTASWQIQSYALSFNASHAQILQSSVEFEKVGNTYSLPDVEFASVITFKVVADNGYVISDNWGTMFEVVINEDKTANVTFTMPAQEVSYILPIVAIENEVKVRGEHIGEILAYDITDEVSEIKVTDGTFLIETGRKVKLTVSAELGFKMIDFVLTDDENLSVQKVLENDKLTLQISGITKDTIIDLSTEKSTNFVTLDIDNIAAISAIEVGNLTYNDLANLPRFETITNEPFIFFVSFNHGYTLNEIFSSDFTVTPTQEDGRVLVEVTNIITDGSICITTKRDQFTIKIEVISYNENREIVEVADNLAFVNGQSEVAADFESEVILTYQVASKYSFAGWSTDINNVFSDENSFVYKVTKDETIYAIFSTMRFNITLATFDYYTIYDEYKDADKRQEIYKEIGGANYLDSATGNSISSFELYFGANKSFEFVVPEGYRYYGYGYNSQNGFVYLDREERSEKQIRINISSQLLEVEKANITLYVVIKSYSTTISLKTMIDVNGQTEKDLDVGYIELVDSDAKAVNNFGYVDGTRVHYEAEHSDKEFSVVAYSGDRIYVKIKTLKEGYKFLKLVANNDVLSCLQVVSNDEYVLYEISNIVGGMQGLSIEVIYKPYLNTINLSFENSGNIVDGGEFTVKASSDSQNKIWWSGRDYSAISVSAYTDSSFEVFAYIRAGYYIERQFLKIEDESNIVVAGSVKYEELSVEDTGYTGRLTFKVSNYLGINEIKICVTASTYTVVLKEGDTPLAQIEKVAFGSTLNLYELNSTNITCLDERITFVNGKLKVDLQKANHNFEGFFTYENGAGVRYINSQGDAVNSWKESGYKYNSLTQKYQLADNAHINEQTGEMEISIYIYWSYLKTRISFEVLPNISTNHTAQDMISGVDYTNSWFYETAPNYIEIAFNTNIQITAPDLDGYKFYKFVVSQKDASGLWLADVEAYSNSIPWSTNELDRIVECNIKVIYFAKVEVVVVGGEGSYNIVQETSDTQARLLLQDGYVDTTKPFEITATAGEGYEFIRWSGNPYGQSTLNLHIDSKITLIMTLQGEFVTLDFSGYDHTHGQILTVRTLSLDNSVKTYRIGAYSGNDFLPLVNQVDVKVGDKVTFIMSVENGFAVSWQGRNDITYVDYLGGMSYFEMDIVPTFSGRTLQIIPIFDNTIISLYVVREFADYNELALDQNNVDLAGDVSCEGVTGNMFKIARGEEIRVANTLKLRYEIDSIVIKNYDKTFTDFIFEDGVIILSSEYIEQNNIIGNVQLLINYRRALWSMEDGSFAGDGSTSNPYKIMTVEDLSLMMTYINSGKLNSSGVRYQDCAYILLADLDLTEKFWTPIGTQEFAFNGYFNFNNHKITGINNALFFESTRYNGLFGVLGKNAHIVASEPNYWYIYLTVGIVVFLILLLVILIVVARKRKKHREEMSKK